MDKKEKLNKLLYSSINSVVPILIAFAIGAIAIILAKENPLSAYGTLFYRSLFNIKGIFNTLHFAGPLILTGLAIAISFKAGLFNMGIEGQLLSAGFVVAVMGNAWGELPKTVLVPLLLVVGVLVGVIVAIIPTMLKAFYNVNEMVVTLLLNYAIIHVLQYLTENTFRDPSSGYVSTPRISSNAIPSRIFEDYRLTTFFIVAIVVFVIFYFIMKRSKLGFEITALGQNRNFAEATGMRIQKKIIIIMLTSGALAGLAGAGWMMSEKYAYTLSFSGIPGLGWDGMLIALLGSHSPIGILIAAVFYAVVKTGSSNIAIFTSVPYEIVILLQALIVLFLSLKVFVKPKDMSLGEPEKPKKKLKRIFKFGGKGGKE